MKKPGTTILTSIGITVLLGWPGSAPAQQERALPRIENSSSTQASAGSQADRPMPAERNPRYRICRSDVLVFSFPLSPELNQKVTVQPDGFISLQNAGYIHVEGLTVAGVVEAVKKAYAGTLHDPIVDLDLADFQ